MQENANKSLKCYTKTSCSSATTKVGEKLQLSSCSVHERIQRGDRVQTPPPPTLEKLKKNIGFLSNIDPVLLKNYNCAKPAFIVGPSSSTLSFEVGPPLTKLSGSAHGLFLSSTGPTSPNQMILYIVHKEC